jgi:hypothetical protein
VKSHLPDTFADIGTAETARETSLDYLLARLTFVEDNVRRVLARKMSFGTNPSDPLRGLYISDQEMTILLASPPMAPERSRDSCVHEDRRLPRLVHASPGEPELSRLSRVFRLTETETEFLLIALAPDLDRRFERFYGYLNDDASQRRATIGLALELCSLSPADRGAVASLSEGAPLLDEGLIIVQERDRPFLGRSLRVPDHIRHYLLGYHSLHPDLRPWTTDPPPLPAHGESCAQAALRLQDGPLIYVREQRAASAKSMIASDLAALRLEGLFLDLTGAGSQVDVGYLVRLARIQSALDGVRLVMGPVEQMLQNGSLGWLGLEARGTVLVGKAPWDPAWSAEVPLLLEAPALSPSAQREAWLEYLGPCLSDELDPLSITAPFHLDLEQMHRAARAACLQAEVEEAALSPGHLVAGARSQGTAGLERLARRIDPAALWEELVLPDDTLDQLRELAGRVRNRQLVLDIWGLRRRSRGEGLAALFAGPSGTGKTMAAEVLAKDLGLYLYVVNLAAVIDKYIGETEKNLDRIFREAETASCLLLFDEADALFGKRSDVKDAHDRYANTETAYLLQRMEEFGGIAILSTNLRSNLDEAFTRRLDSIVEFLVPTPDLRRMLWEKCLGSTLPRAEDLDVAFLARAFEIAGGNIRNIVLTAAYLAAADGRPVEMRDLIRGTEREYRKLGRLCRQDDFGPYYELVS